MEGFGMDTTLLTVCGTVMVAFFSLVGVWIRINFNRQKYYENKVSELLRMQSAEIKSLKQEVGKLVRENQLLRHELEKRDKNEGSVQEVVRQVAE